MPIIKGFQRTGLLIGLLTSIMGQAQKQGNVWYFGIQAGLNFNTSVPTALLGGQTYTPLPNLWNEGTSTICDSTGVLLMYSNGEKIWRRDHQVMQNGQGLMGHPSSTHAALIVPRPGSERYFHVFTTDASENAFANGLRHSVVDICLDDGHGAVLDDQKNILLAGPMAEKLAAVRHANNEDYWVIGHGFNTNTFHAFLFTADGIVDTVLSNVGPVDVLGWGGQIVVSPDGSRLAYAFPSTFGWLSLFDFNTATGVVSNPRTHQNQINDQSWGVGFSPDATKLYVTAINAGKLFQYDLSLGSWAETIAERTLLAAELPDTWRDVKLGPDNKVYVARSLSLFLGRIEQPDLPGTACQYVAQAVHLGGQYASFGLPTHIAGYAYSNTTKDCNAHTGLSPISDQPSFSCTFVNGTLQVTCAASLRNGHMVVTDPSGRICGTYSMGGAEQSTMHLGALAAGTYQATLIGGEQRMARSTFVVVD
jgi:hypothetical protein